MRVEELSERWERRKGWVINSNGVVELCLELEIITEKGLVWGVNLLGTILSRMDEHFAIFSPTWKELFDYSWSINHTMNQ